MAQQPSQVGDVIKNLDTRVSVLESAVVDDDATIDMFRLFSENVIANDTFKVSTHGYVVCGPGTLCSTNFII